MSTPKKAAAGGSKGEKRSESPKKPGTPAKSQTSAAGDKKGSKSTGADIRNFVRLLQRSQRKVLTRAVWRTVAGLKRER